MVLAVIGGAISSSSIISSVSSSSFNEVLDLVGDCTKEERDIERN